MAGEGTTMTGDGEGAGEDIEPASERHQPDPENVERILVAGASGRTGRQILTQLRDSGLTVRAATRSPDARDRLFARGADEVVVVDLLEGVEAAGAVADCDAVLCAVGSESVRDVLRPKLVDGRGVENLATAAVAAGVESFVLESAIGVGDSAAMLPAPARLALGRVLAAKERGEEAVRTAGVAHTILRPGRLTEGTATGDVLVGEGGDTVTGAIPRADVARLLVAAPFTPAAANRTFEVVSRTGARGTPSALVEVDWRWPWEERERGEGGEAATVEE